MSLLIHCGSETRSWHVVVQTEILRKFSEHEVNVTCAFFCLPTYLMAHKVYYLINHIT